MILTEVCVRVGGLCDCGCVGAFSNTQELLSLGVFVCACAGGLGGHQDSEDEVTGGGGQRSAPGLEGVVWGGGGGQPVTMTDFTAIRDKGGKDGHTVCRKTFLTMTYDLWTQSV